VYVVNIDVDEEDDYIENYPYINDPIEYIKQKKMMKFGRVKKMMSNFLSDSFLFSSQYQNKKKEKYKKLTRRF
jgi:hypothetical protein